MAGKTSDPKPHRVTMRLSESDMRLLRKEAHRQRKSVGAVLRTLIRANLGPSR